MSEKLWGLFYLRPDDACWCESCDRDGDYWPRMNLCPDCGNKRCPKATYHGQACSAGSNEPGQPGSSYSHDFGGAA